MLNFTVYAPAKLNLYLDVLEKRPDGYHNIEALFEKIDLKDEIVIRQAHKGIDVKIEPPTVCPSGRDNIVYKAAQALLKETGANLGLEIIIKKHIPVSAGLGGGSSDAASCLRSINEEFELDVSFERLLSMASEMGADVPFFMLDSSFAVGFDKGDRLEPIDTDCAFSHVVITPDISISTAQMYNRLDGYNRRRSSFDVEETALSIRNKDISSLNKNCYNIFEEFLGDYSGDISKARDLLSQTAERSVFLSGSGPSVFCTVKERGEAMKIAEKIPEEKGLKVFVATTYNSA